jgi:hypothetical protein
MKKKIIASIAAIWIAVAVVSLSLIVMPIGSRNAGHLATPLGLGVGLIPILLVLGIITSFIIIKTRKKYVYDWYPAERI